MKLVNQTNNQQQNVLTGHLAGSGKWQKLVQGVCSAAVFSLSVGLTSASVVFANDQLTERPFAERSITERSITESPLVKKEFGRQLNGAFEQPDAGQEDENFANAQSSEPALPKVNINLANFEQLVALPGIGKVKANAILAYREEFGAFNALSDIQNIKGIGSKLFAKLSNLIEI